MALEMKVPSPGESITEVEIATWRQSNVGIASRSQWYYYPKS